VKPKKGTNSPKEGKIRHGRKKRCETDSNGATWERTATGGDSKGPDKKKLQDTVWGHCHNNTVGNLQMGSSHWGGKRRGGN